MKNLCVIPFTFVFVCFLVSCSLLKQDGSTTVETTEKTDVTVKTDKPEAPPIKKEKAKSTISSVYTDFKTNCKSGEIAEEGRTCPGVEDYQIFFDDSAIDYGIEAQTTDGKVTIELAHQPFDSDFQNRNIEWRLSKGKPFAIILRVDEFVKENNGATSKKTSGQNLIIKGLKGFEHIDFKVDARKTRNANQKARDLADKALAKS
jgi:hypothetical protein